MQKTVLHIFDFGVQQMPKILTAKWNKAFGERYVISKTKVKWSLLVVVIDYFKKVHLREFWEKPKKRVSQETIWCYLNKRVHYIYYQLRLF